MDEAQNMDLPTGIPNAAIPPASRGATGGGIPFPPPSISRRGSNDSPHSSGGYEPAIKRVRNLKFVGQCFSGL